MALLGTGHSLPQVPLTLPAQAAEDESMLGTKCCFIEKGEGKSLGAGMTTEEAANLLGTREKGVTLKMVYPMNLLADIIPEATGCH